MLPEKVTHRYAGQMGFRHSNTRRYVYDAMGNITHVYEDSELVARYTYDSLGRLIREDAVGFGTRIYTYDACGNILSRRQLGLTMEDTEKISPLTGTTVYYEYEGDRMVSYNGDGCKYDDIGNPTFYRNNSEEANVTWTDGRRLASYNGCTFTYDGMGRRMTKGNTTYTYDFDGRLLRQSDGIRTLTFLYDHTGLAAVDYVNTQNSHFGGLYTYVKDIQGNIVSLIDKDGNPVVKYTYDAWGNCIERDSAGAEIDNEQKIALINPFRYRGYYFDTETGLYYLKTRYYDPEVGRFINADSVTFLNANAVNGLNLFAYCGNNPVNKFDPTGQFPWLLVIVAAVLLSPVGGKAVQATTSAVSYIGMAITSIWDEEVRNDMNAIGWNPFNSDEFAVVNSSKVSFYKGVPVFRTNLDRSGSFCALFMNADAGETDVKHEYGHTRQQLLMGPIKYGLMIGLPSWLKWSDKKYYRRPWEITADIFGGVDPRPEQTQRDREIGFWYLAVSSLFGPFGYFFLFGEYGEE